jgi:uncharacterized protein (DUF305 family)
MKKKVLALGLVGIVSLVAACGSGDEDSRGDTTTTVAAEKATGGFNDADVTFAQSMIPHHEQAVEMAEIALDPTVDAGDEVRDLAERIQGAQDPEIRQMTDWLKAWGKPVAMETSNGHDMSSMEGMMSTEEMDDLATKKGSEFDRAWMDMMIRHHEGAIAMAETELQDGQNDDVKTLAAAIIKAQRAEIEEMRELLG